MIKQIVNIVCMIDGMLFKYVKIQSSQFNRSRLTKGLGEILGKKNLPVLIKESCISGNIKINYAVKILECNFNTSNKGEIIIGRFNSINGTKINAGDAKVVIGSFCSVAEGVRMLTYGHNKNRLTTYYINRHLFKCNTPDDVHIKGDIFIEDDVWIGTNAIILGGVHIGRGSIIAAGSVVTKDVEPYSIIGGVPAKRISMRFSQEIIDRLNNLKWWTWSIDKLKENKHLFNVNLNEEEFPMHKQ